MTAPTSVIILPATVSPRRGASLIIRYTPAFTIVAECSRAEDGVGATIAPKSQEENGSCADFVSAATQSKNTAASTSGTGLLAVRADSSII